MSIGSQFLQIILGNNGKQGPSLDTMLEHFDQELANFDQLVEPAPVSKPRTPFDGDTPRERQSVAQMTGKQRMSVLPIMLPLMWQMKKSSKLYDGKFVPAQNTADPRFIAELEKIAFDMGATAVKYVKVPRSAIFEHKGIPHQYAIVFTVRMDKENMSTAPSFEAFREVAKGYKNLAVISNRMSSFMRQHGFAAYPGTALGGLTDYCHIAELAGLGAIGYHGLLISPDDGALLRINTIYTNITNLPLETENEHLWVRDFCAMCRKCIRKCPVDAIYETPQPRGDGGMQCIDHDACRSYFSENFGCAICLAECPFSQVGYEKVKSRFKGNPGAPQFQIPVESIQVMA